MTKVLNPGEITAKRKGNCHGAKQHKDRVFTVFQGPAILVPKSTVSGTSNAKRIPSAQGHTEECGLLFLFLVYSFYFSKTMKDTSSPEPGAFKL